jgi:hypothetical protein
MDIVSNALNFCIQGRKLFSSQLIIFFPLLDEIETFGNDFVCGFLCFLLLTDFLLERV